MAVDDTISMEEATAPKRPRIELDPPPLTKVPGHGKRLLCAVFDRAMTYDIKGPIRNHVQIQVAVLDHMNRHHARHDDWWDGNPSKDKEETVPDEAWIHSVCLCHGSVTGSGQVLTGSMLVRNPKAVRAPSFRTQQFADLQPQLRTKIGLAMT